MPRPNKAVKRQKTNAAIEWKKGNRKGAQKLWGDADKARKELQAKKKKGKPAEKPEEPVPAEGEPSEGEG